MNLGVETQNRHRPLWRSYAASKRRDRVGSRSSWPLKLLSTRVVPSAWLRTVMVASMPSFDPRIRPPGRSTDVTLMPLSCAARSAASQARS